MGQMFCRERRVTFHPSASQPAGIEEGVIGRTENWRIVWTCAEAATRALCPGRSTFQMTPPHLGGAAAVPGAISSRLVNSDQFVHSFRGLSVLLDQ